VYLKELKTRLFGLDWGCVA